MAIYSLGDLVPQVDGTAYIHPDAVLIGAVVVGAESSVWPSAVLRGDDNSITVGARTSIQDGSVLHVTPELATTVGNDCTIGHLVHLEGCVIEDMALVGNGAVVLHEAVVSRGALVAANAVVRNRQIVPPDALALGIPAEIREGKADAFLIEDSRDKYVARAKHYRDALRRLD